METESRRVSVRNRGERERNEEAVYSGYRSSFEIDEKLLKMNGGDGCTAMRMHLIPQKCTVKIVNSTLCIYYHNLKKKKQFRERILVSL